MWCSMVPLANREGLRSQKGETMPFQGDWMHCSLCQTLCYTGLWNGTNTGPCRANPGGPHNFTGSPTYVLIYDEDGAPGQPNWKACLKCRQLVFSERPGNCAAGGAHDFSLSGNYKATGGQSNWRWCSQCQAMISGGPLPAAVGGPQMHPVGGPFHAACPGPGPSKVHVHAGSNYNFLTIAL